MAKKKILIVDDSKTALMLERMVLGTSAYELVEAVDGEDALAKAIAEKPDLILLDVVMPKLDGFETCKRLRSMEETRTIPIIMVTTRGEENNVEKAYASGCTDFVTKPIDRMELSAKVRRHLGE